MQTNLLLLSLSVHFMDYNTEITWTAQQPRHKWFNIQSEGFKDAHFRASIYVSIVWDCLVWLQRSVPLKVNNQFAEWVFFLAAYQTCSLCHILTDPMCFCDTHSKSNEKHCELSDLSNTCTCTHFTQDNGEVKKKV